jgi:hypothetical protein
MVIPALNENGEDLFRSRLFMIASHLLIESALSALNNSSDFAEARGTLNPEARDSVLNRLNQIAHNDPIPIFMHTLAVDERERLAPVSQPNLHAYLIGFDWLTALNTALPAEPADIFDSLSLHASLLAYTQRIDVSLHL